MLAERSWVVVGFGRRVVVVVAGVVRCDVTFPLLLRCAVVGGGGTIVAGVDSRVGINLMGSLPIEFS